MVSKCNRKTEYQLVDKTLRDMTDLRDYETEITRGVRLSLGNGIGIEVKARKFVLDGNISSAEARVMGRMIAKCCKGLAGHVREYHSVSGRSGQLFKRIQDRKEA